MITFITHMRVRPENQAAYEAVLTEMCAKTLQNEPCVVHYSFAKSVKDPDAYVVVEVYSDEACVRAHAETEYLKALLPQASALVEDGKFEIAQFVGPDQAASPGR